MKSESKFGIITTCAIVVVFVTLSQIHETESILSVNTQSEIISCYMSNPDGYCYHLNKGIAIYHDDLKENGWYPTCGDYEWIKSDFDCPFWESQN